MASTTTTRNPSHAWLKGLGTKLHACASRLRSHFSFLAASTTASSSAVVLLPALAIVLLVCGGTVLSRVVVFFLPLVVSTSVCCAAVCLLVADASEEPEEAKEVVLRCGGGRAQPPEVGLLEVYGGANASAYGGRRDVVAGCFLLRRPGGTGGWTKRGVHGHEDGEEVVFAGRVVAAGSGDDELRDGGVTALEEELVALRVDRVAEGVWDRYFGECGSRWNYVRDGC
ncbi:uncharacterized protein LOC104582533 [Brachypodium distachyon]|uniref:Uncharacterized protein n=1 Tax=Brachypodium distachyon TaxID=15368 RepID=I1HDW1_BRADI|nr:uncharacterized protein LOC104582533 [Brachypodium distachyon]KQK03591.1 hypothetical protein BRADI_2g08737v3 [Brachypodium distachyon]|eukprot:XP_010230692.1 uncharacterized protein LOC104582533 [Brachypodium distachyon]